MIEPLSVTTGVAGLLGAIATVAVKLSTLKQRWDQSGLNIAMTYSSLFSVKRVLESIQRLREKTYDASEASQQLDEDLAVPLESCAVLMAGLERSLEGIDVENPSRMERGRFMILKETFEQAERSLDIQLRALQVMLTIYQCESAEQRERLNRRDTRKMLDLVRQETASAFQRLEEQDVSDVASMLSREPSIKFPFDYEILQSPMYKRVYHDLYLKYKAQSSRASVAAIPSPRNSTSGPPAYPPPPVPQPASNVQSPIQSNTYSETTRNADSPNSPYHGPASPSSNLSSSQKAETAVVTSPPGSAMLSPDAAEHRGRKKRKSTSSLQKMDMAMPDIMFLGVPFKGETVELSSEESEDEETEPQESDSVDAHSSHGASDIYGVSDDEKVEDHVDEAPSVGKPGISINDGEPDRSTLSTESKERKSSASLPAAESTPGIARALAVNNTERPASTVSGLYLGNAELERLQQTIRSQRARAATASAVTPSSRTSLDSRQAGERERSASDSRRQGLSANVSSRGQSRSPPREESPAVVSEAEHDEAAAKQESFSPNINLPLLETETSAFKIDFGPRSGSRSSQEPEEPAAAAEQALAEENSKPSFILKRQLTVEDAVPPPLLVRKSPPVPVISPPPPEAPPPGPPAQAPPGPPGKNLPPLPPSPEPSSVKAASASSSPLSPSTSNDPTPPIPPPPRSAPPVPPRPVSPPQLRSSPPIPPRPVSTGQPFQTPQAEPQMSKASSPSKLQAKPMPSPPVSSPPPPESVGIAVETSPIAPPTPTSRPMRPISRKLTTDSPRKAEAGQEGLSSPAAPPKRPPPAPPSRRPPSRPASSPRLSIPSPGSQSHTPELPSENPANSPVQYQTPPSHPSPRPDQAPMLASPVESTSRLVADDASTVGSTLSGSRTSSSYNDTRTLSNTVGTQATAFDENSWVNSEFDAGEVARQQAIFSSLEKQRKKSNNDAGPSGTTKLRVMPSKASLTKMFVSKDKAMKTKVLHDAARRGETRIVAEYLKDNRSAINRLEKIDDEETSKSLLMRAAKGNHVECMEYLITHGAEFAQTDREGRAALHHAVQAGSATATQWLADHFEAAPSTGNAPVGPLELADSDGFRPLHIAAGTGNLPIVKLLLDRGAKINSTDRYGRTALYPAIITHSIDIIQLLLECGASVLYEDSDKHTPLMWAAEANSQKVAEIFLEKGADRDAVDNKGNSAIHLAAKSGALALVEMLYLSLKDLEASNGIGERPIHLAAAADRPQVVKALLRIGCDPNQFTRPNTSRRTPTKNATYKDRGASPLHYACANGAYDSAAHLIDHGAKVNAGQEDGTSPLMLAASFGSALLCSLLLERNANVEAQTSVEQLTPLHFALVKGDVETTKLLANSGADPKARNRKRETAWQYATKNGDPSKYNEATRWLVQFEHTQRAVMLRANQQRQQEQRQQNLYQHMSPWPIYSGYPTSPPMGRPNMQYTSLSPVPAVPSPGSVAAAPTWGYTDTGYAVNQSRFYRPPHIEASARTEQGVEPPPAYSPPGTRPAQ